MHSKEILELTKMVADEFDRMIRRNFFMDRRVKSLALAVDDFRQYQNNLQQLYMSLMRFKDDRISLADLKTHYLSLRATTEEYLDIINDSDAGKHPFFTGAIALREFIQFGNLLNDFIITLEKREEADSYEL